MKTVHRKEVHDWGTMTWLIDDEIAPSPGISLAMMTVNPNSISPAHKHPDCTETIHLLSGKITQRRGDEWIELEQGETIFIQAGLIHQTKTRGSEPARLMIAYSSGSRLYQS